MSSIRCEWMDGIRKASMGSLKSGRCPVRATPQAAALPARDGVSGGAPSPRSCSTHAASPGAGGAAEQQKHPVPPKLRPPCSPARLEAASAPEAHGVAAAPRLLLSAPWSRGTAQKLSCLSFERAARCQSRCPRCWRPCRRRPHHWRRSGPPPGSRAARPWPLERGEGRQQQQRPRARAPSPPPRPARSQPWQPALTTVRAQLSWLRLPRRFQQGRLCVSVSSALASPPARRCPRRCWWLCHCCWHAWGALRSP